MQKRANMSTAVTMVAFILFKNEVPEMIKIAVTKQVAVLIFAIF